MNRQLIMIVVLAFVLGFFVAIQGQRIIKKQMKHQTQHQTQQYDILNQLGE